MADWQFRGIKCPRCRGYKREPVNLHQLPPLEEKSELMASHHIYLQQCHECSMIGVSPALAQAYGETWKRLTRLCQQKELECRTTTPTAAGR